MTSKSRGLWGSGFDDTCLVVFEASIARGLGRI